MKKSGRKTVKWTGLILSMAFCLAAVNGCGRKEPDTTAAAQDEFAYVAEYKEIALGDSYVNQWVEIDGAIFGQLGEYDEATEVYVSKIVKIQLSSSEIEKLGPIELPENSYVNRLAKSADQNLLMLVNQYSMGENAGPEENKYLLYEYSLTGELLTQKDITSLIAETGASYVQNMVTDKQGNIYLTAMDDMGKTTIVVTDPEGQPAGTIVYNEYIDAMFAAEDGKIYITGYGSNGIEIRPLDLAAKTVGSPIDMPIGNYGNLLFTDSGQQGTLLTDRRTVYACDMTAGKAEPLFKWLDSDVDSNNISLFGSLEEGKIWALSTPYSSTGGQQYELLILTKTPASQIAEKTILMYGTMWVNNDIQKAIINFNKANDQYRIKIEEYGGDADYEAGLNRMNADIISGKCPDIIDLGMVNYQQLSAKGVFEDLYPFMDQDAGIDRSNYLENVFSAYEVDGKLYGFLTSFGISTLVGKEVDFKDRSSWTLNEMIQYAKDHPDSKMLQTSASGAIYMCLNSNMDQFIDWNTGECFFGSEDFISILEFAKGFPMEYDYSEGTHEALTSGQLLMLNENISSVRQLQMVKGMFGEAVTYIGYPTTEDGKGGGNMISSYSGSFGMSAKSKGKEGVWEFFSFLLSDTYQEGLADGTYGYGMNLPVNRAALDIMIQQAMKKEYGTDENGNQIEISNHSWGYNDFTIELYASTEEEVAQFMQIVESAQGLYQNDTQILTIIEEEAAPFFADQKSAKEAADIIQSRVQIYVNENR